MNEVIDQALSILRRKSIDGYEVYLEQSSHFYVESKDGLNQQGTAGDPTSNRLPA